MNCSRAIGVLSKLDCTTVLCIYISCAVGFLLLLIIVGLSVAICSLAARIRTLSRRCQQHQSGSVQQTETEDLHEGASASESIGMKEIQDTGVSEVDAMYDVVMTANLTYIGTGNENSTPSSSKARPTRVKYEDVIFTDIARKTQDKNKNNKESIASAVSDAQGEKEQTSESNDSLTVVYSVPNKKPDQKQKSLLSVADAAASQENAEYSQLAHGPSKQGAGRNLASSNTEQYSRIGMSYRQSTYTNSPSHDHTEDIIPPVPPPLELDDPALQGDTSKKSWAVKRVSIQGCNEEALYSNSTSLGLQTVSAT